MKEIVTKLFYTTLVYLLIPVELIRLYMRGRIIPECHLRWSERFAISLPAAKAIKKGWLWILGEFLSALIRHFFIFLNTY